MRKKDLPEIIFFEEKAGSNGIHCLDYKNSSNIKYIREDVVKNLHKAHVSGQVCGCSTPKFYQESYHYRKCEHCGKREYPQTLR